MRVNKVRGDDCPDGRTCPAVHLTDSGSLIVIGRVVTDNEILSQIAVGDGELAVEVPGTLLPEVSDCAVY